MKIAIASGKGGTGKTTVATNLAAVVARGVWYADCDVEEPNGHLFLRPEIENTLPFNVAVPVVDYDRCTFCGECHTACRFNAIAVLPKSVMIFHELCHSCGGCKLACPEKAISEEPRRTGIIEEGQAGHIHFIHGRLNIGEAMSPPLIRAVKEKLPEKDTVIIDSPPGTSCPVIAAVKDTDVCLLVTEPTPFGLNDLILAVEMVRTLGIPFGVIINRDGIGDRGVEDYCTGENIPIVARIPDTRAIAESYSKGDLAIDAVPELRPVFRSILDWAERNKIKKEKQAI
jgi:MinD superfamily P-loop ATPase